MRRVVWRALRSAVAAVLGACAAVVLVVDAGVVDVPVGATVESSSGAERLEEQRIVGLVDEHDCWTDDGGQHPLPTHAVVTKPGAEQASYVGAGWTSRALEHVFGEPTAGLTVHAFCP